MLIVLVSGAAVRKIPVNSQGEADVATPGRFNTVTTDDDSDDYDDDEDVIKPRVHFQGYVCIKLLYFYMFQVLFTML